ncbi:MAG: anti-FecI sigma factor, FecR [Mucilaginibacter sp.]|nr:anti-FecI sigma factor, FecR [Mucilaginibacter sp.]
MDKVSLQDLIEKIDKGTATEHELGLYNAYMNRIAPGSTDWDQFNLDDQEQVRLELWDQLQVVMQKTQPRRFVLWTRISGVAALVLICLSITGYFLFSTINQSGKHSLAQVNQDILPGGNKAILTLSNGHRIVLSDAKHGVLVSKNNIRVNKNSDGQLTYEAKNGDHVSNIAYDTLTTPTGGIYNIVLADGSKIWLNSATSIRFPEIFGSKERKIELISGEAYFEVIHNPFAPFRVATPHGIVEDLGTHFNINTYGDESAEKTTLLEGSISVKSKNQKVVLQPGQQALIDNKRDADPIAVSAADLDEAIAWKNGLFLFNNEDLESIMRKISRWYNVKVVYQDQAVKREIFLGSVSKLKNASEVINMLEKTGKIHFEVNGSLIIVKAK